jgi:hypothetical protein
VSVCTPQLGVNEHRNVADGILLPCTERSSS